MSGVLFPARREVRGIDDASSTRCWAYCTRSRECGEQSVRELSGAGARLELDWPSLEHSWRHLAQLGVEGESAPEARRSPAIIGSEDDTGPRGPRCQHGDLALAERTEQGPQRRGSQRRRNRHCFERPGLGAEKARGGRVGLSVEVQDEGLVYAFDDSVVAQRFNRLVNRAPWVTGRERIHISGGVQSAKEIPLKFAVPQPDSKRTRPRKERDDSLRGRNQPHAQ